MTVLWNIAERGYTRYIKHAAAATTGPLTNGEPVDAGTSMLVTNNLGHMCMESTRNLVQSPGTGPTGIALSYQTPAALFGGIQDTGFYTAATDVLYISGSTALPWDPRVSETFSAFTIADRQNSDGRETIRSIRFSIDFTADVTNSSTSVGFAITTHDSPQRLRDGDYLAFYGSESVNTGSQIITNTLSSDTPITLAHYEAMQARQRTYNGEMMGNMIPIVLWFGWKFIGSGTDNAINGFCAWESRIDPA